MEPGVLQATDWGFILANWQTLLLGVAVTVLLTVTSLTLGFALGFPSGAIEVYGDGWLANAVSTAGVLLRGTPIVVLIMTILFGLPIPRLGTVPVIDMKLNAFVAATLALGLRSAAYQGQVFRGSIQSISEGHLEAARSVGMTKLQAIRHVVFPQAIRRSLPGFQNEFTIVLKDTSIAFAIGLGELLKRSYDLMFSQTTAALELFLAISLVYFVLTFTTNRALDILSSRFAIPGGDD